MAIVSAALMMWDIHNQRVISAMGMAWDTGAPNWPYQTPDTILFFLNLPAFLFSNTVSNFLKLHGSLHYLAFYPAIVAWWLMAGDYLDQRPLRKGVERATLSAVAILLVAVAFIVMGFDLGRAVFIWWWTCSHSLWTPDDVTLLRLGAPAFWCLLLGLAALDAGLRRFRSMTVKEETS
jgi:hypothetical protein